MGILMPLVPGALIATAASNVPGLLPSVAGFTVTRRVAGKLPAVGLTLSQDDVLVLVVVVAVKLVTLGLELVRVTLWVAAAEVPAGKTKLSEFGFAVIELDRPVFAFKETGMEIVLDAEVTLTKPTLTPEVGAPAPMETARTKGVVPAPGVTVSQLVLEIAATVTGTVPLAEEIRILCVAGVTTPS